MPREKHLEAVLNILSYTQGNHDYRLALDLTDPDIYHASFKKHNFFDFYVNIKEKNRPNMTDLRGKDLDLRIYLDNNHSGDKSTLISRTGLLV